MQEHLKRFVIIRVIVVSILAHGQSNAFVESGGFLPDDWRRVTRVLDLTALGFD